MTLLLHSLGANYNQFSDSRNQSQLGDRGPGSIVITPEGRGPDGWYYGHAGADAFGKPKSQLRKLEKGPFYAIDCGIGSKRFPCPTLTLGGLVIDERTGQVKRADGSLIGGLYAAGRTAVSLGCTACSASAAYALSCSPVGGRGARSERRSQPPGRRTGMNIGDASTTRRTGTI